MSEKEEDEKVGDLVDRMCVIAICDNLLMCEGITLFDRGEEEGEEGCPLGSLAAIEVWEEKYENEWLEEGSK